ncbi:MAG: MBL fold metallo-hydrolase [Clostridia bacterium]|nr:MBL fold metallo-hydrolase [Clostridia bacterium]
MKKYKIYPKGFGANTYLLTADEKTAVVIDPSGEHVSRELSARGLTPAFVLLTHCHFDHVFGVSALQKQGAKVVCLDLELPLVGTRADLFELFGAPRTAYTVERTVKNGEEFTLAGLRFTAMSLPGHTAGSAGYLVENGEEKWLFSGDTLFEDSIGRTDFPTGSAAQIRQSLLRLKSLEGDWQIFAGHGEDTTLNRERKYNMFLAE